MDNSSTNDEENEAIERVLHIAQLRAEVENVAGSPIVGEGGVGGNLKTQEAFWEHIHAFETAPEMSLNDALLERRGFRAPPLEQLLTDEALHTALWKLLHTLASMRVFFHCSDHLSDRAFYCLLLNEVLTAETQIMPDGSEWNCRYDMTEFASEDVPEANEIYLKYYADDAEREYWNHQFPDDTMPGKAERPYDRDRFLPIPPEEQESHT
ncbi:hypothetical protein SH580_02575 [Coraliomargarita algicola]|uniref:DUF4240 domain-containing protein n=1 Tax=Coraliomargarita algicola TaxID=3092156 RepID=A0ABZ0RKK2_9BACT|nr:hypothetical protein [Coraliomargarita sp. J2-16]WPJ96587.1 hypothetical protein SH580_02575 [Coraliomargarita sp. J2-16]